MEIENSQSLKVDYKNSVAWQRANKKIFTILTFINFSFYVLLVYLILFIYLFFNILTCIWKILEQVLFLNIYKL